MKLTTLTYLLLFSFFFCEAKPSFSHYPGTFVDIPKSLVFYRPALVDHDEETSWKSMVRFQSYKFWPFCGFYENLSFLINIFQMILIEKIKKKSLPRQLRIRLMWNGHWTTNQGCRTFRTDGVLRESKAKSIHKCDLSPHFKLLLRPCSTSLLINVIA